MLIDSVHIDPETIARRLAIEPSKWQRKGGPMAGSLRRPQRIAELDGWFLSTRGRVRSRDLRRHIDWLLDQIEGKAAESRALRNEEGRIRISCYWASRFGEGGPTISPDQMRRLGALNLELSFDIYFVDEDGPASL